MREKSGCSATRIKRVLLILLSVAALNFSCRIIPCCAGDDLYEARLDEGLSNTEAYSYLLITQARQDRDAAKALIEKAKRYSPDLPAVYFELAREGFTPSANGIFQSFDYFRQGLRAYGRNFWWEFGITGSVYTSLVISFVLSISVILAVRLPMETSLILHDGREERKRLMLLALPVLLSLLGPVGLIAGVSFLTGFYFRKENKAVVYASFLFLLFSPFLLREATPFLSSPSPLRGIVAVNEGKDNKFALWTLRGRNDFASSFSYALALKREGDYQSAIETFKSLAGRLPGAEPRVYINLGNAYYGLKDMEAAKESYLKSIEITPFPSAFYNLSQIHREMLDFAKGNEYFLEAAKLSPEAVSRFAAISGSNPNRFVVDEPLPISAFWDYAMRFGKSPLSGFQFVGPFVAVLMMAGFYFLDKRVRHRAQRCKRCGAVYCSRCSRTITWGEMCPSCFGSLIKIDEVDSRERIARLLSIYQSQMKRRRRAKLGSCLIPGAGHIYSGKILTGLLFLWPFMFAVTLIVVNYSPISGLFPFTHAWITPVMVICIILAYAGSVFHIRRRIQKGWL
jgi:tetratricopeptide (TPR) repeat protein